MKICNKYFLYGLSIILFSFSFNLAFAQTDIYGGVISQDTTWTKDGSPYIIYSSLNGESNFTVDSGVTLTIEAGVVVKFDYEEHGINVLGKLITNGTADEKVYFTSIDDDSVGGDTNLDGDLVEPYNADWVGIQIIGGGNAELNNSIISYSESAVSADNSSVTLNNVDIINGWDGISAYESSVDINNSNIENLLGDAFTLDSTSSISLIFSNVKNIDGDGKIDFTISGSQEFDPIIYLQILKKTIEAFDASKKIKDEISKKIDSIIKSLQKGKTKAAILKIKSFSKELSMKVKDRQDKEDKKHKDDKNWKNKKHKLSSDDAEVLLTMLNQLLDNLMK